MLDGVEHCYEDSYYLFCVSPLLFRGMAVFVSRVDETDSSEVSYACSDCSQAVSSGPETVIACAIPKHQHETDHYGERGYNGRGDGYAVYITRIDVDDQGSEERVEQHW